MKFAVKIMLFVFVLFLSTPTIVSLIEKSTDTSYFYSFSEEEEMHKELIAEFRFQIFDFPINYVFETSNLILSENRSQHISFFDKVFSPPPEFI